MFINLLHGEKLRLIAPIQIALLIIFKSKNSRESGVYTFLPIEKTRWQLLWWTYKETDREKIMNLWEF